MSTADDPDDRLSDTGRVEAFSDGVFAIAVTLLVLDLKEPAHAPGALLDGLIRQWPAYLGYVASFGYVAVIWLNHHQAFAAIKHVDKGVHLANIVLLFTTALIPFPTAVLSHAFIDGADTADARTAVALYAGVLAAMCASWLLLFDQVNRRHGRLAQDGVDRGVFGAQRIRSVVGIIAYLAAGVTGVVWSPMVALAVFVVMPAFYAVSIPGIGRRDRSHS
ncbi:TMEM175 family protein [[Mycobacterium] nativiensis]|uniref:TMEM175 family protein n=1 Tax=[Mycobacterium] nativiensis TaxID=2855503 RepID=A0ABU5Y1S5_9MYCO|nr:TMEM175 family protein [Mycolicibacter sp. MYC340]MEB3034017.1 TMEM175 family protein [Mycolicibacter sp. MYC340]